MIENFKETHYAQCIGMCLSMYKSVGVVMGGWGGGGLGVVYLGLKFAHNSFPPNFLFSEYL